MEAKRVLVTGATSGIGRATAIELARQGARVIVHGRDDARCHETATEVANVSGDVVPYLVADLSSLEAVRRLADDVRALADSNLGGLDVLVANAGIYMPRREVTPDGLEVTFAVNHLSHFLLVELLRDVLEASAPARVVVVSSEAHQRGRIDFNDLMHEHDYSAYQAYADSKLANVLFTYSLAERLDPALVTANCLHPGAIATKLLHADGWSDGLPARKGAETILHLALSEEVANVTGEYFISRQQRTSSPESYKRNVQQRLWDVSEQLVGLRVLQRA